MKSISASLDVEKLTSENLYHIVGVDEVGRGCIAGPVCAGVVFLKDYSLDFSRYVDSKTIPEEKRESLAQEITENHFSALGWASVEEIDQINIRQASLLAMKRALTELLKNISTQESKKDFFALIDGRDVIPNFDLCQQQSVIKGDQKVRQISAASIIAKVARDQLMKKMSNQYLEYGFNLHKGYGTEAHRHAIKKYGVTEIHRKTFAGVKEYL